MPEFLWDIDPAKVTVRRTLRFASIADPSLATPANPHPAQNRGTKGPSFPPPAHIIDGKKFNGDIDQSMVLGATEEWTIINESPGAAHPFHIHINPFQVTEIFNPAGGNTSPVKLPQPWIWWDDFAIYRLVDSIKRKPPLKIWVDTGTAEPGWEQTRELCKRLVEKGWKAGKDLLYMEADHSDHSEAAWAARVEPALRFLFPARK